jgi:hypothetical protein
VNKLKEDLRVGILGAAAGLFSICIPLLIARIDAYYAYLSWLEETNYNSYDRSVENLWWVPIGVWHLILTITASLVAHRHLATRIRSPFLLWQVIGMASLLGWGLTVLLIVSMDCVMRGNLHTVQEILNSGETANIAKYVSAGFACNVFYASVMKASSRQYTTPFNELECESPSVDYLLTTSQMQ